MTIFISGGCKNGKSTIAEDCCAALACGGPLYYIATMQAYDDEDRARIKRHQNSRAGKGFITIEQPRDLLGCLEKSDPENGTYILDSVTALYLMPIGGLLIVLFVGWRMKKADAIDELTNGGTLRVGIRKAIYYLIRYMAPVAILVIFISQLVGK